MVQEHGSGFRWENCNNATHTDPKVIAGRVNNEKVMHAINGPVLKLIHHGSPRADSGFAKPAPAIGNSFADRSIGPTRATVAYGGTSGSLTRDDPIKPVETRPFIVQVVPDLQTCGSWFGVKGCLDQHGSPLRWMETNAHTGSGAFTMPRVAVHVDNSNVGQPGTVPASAGLTGPCNPSVNVALPPIYMPAVT